MHLGGISSEQWSALAQRTIYFGHQSVGGDIVQGIREILAQHPEIPFRFADNRNDSRGLHEFLIGENGNPASKNSSFLVVTAGALAPRPVLMFKYCWVDVGNNTDVEAMFRAYRDTVTELHARHPDATVVHVTMPLTDVEPRLRYLIRRLRGSATKLDQNARRNRFNELLRSEFGGQEPVFDLAGLESTHVDGSPAYANYTGTRVYYLAPEWTTDGGHLNPAGRRRVAEQLLLYLAACCSSR